MNEGPGTRVGQSHLRQIVAALTEGLIILEQDGTIEWADDTALELHGVAKLADLGGSAAGYAKRFQLRYRDGPELAAEQYPMQRLLDGEAIDRAMVEVTRRASGKRWVHEIRTMALTDKQGTPDCLVIILNDETERFNAEERFERAFAANPAPAIIARLSDMRYVKVNAGFLELTGYEQTALIGRSMHEIDVLAAAERRDLAIRRLHAGQTIPQMEAALPLPDGLARAVLLGGQPLQIGDEACMLFTFADLHPREQALFALRQTEERFAKAFHMAPCPMAILAVADWRFVDVNDAFTSGTGWRREELVGRAEAEIGIWDSGALRDNVQRQILQSGQARAHDVRLRTKAGPVRDVLLSAETVEIGRERCALTIMLDITERRQTETELVEAVQAAMLDSSWLGQKILEKLNALTSHRGAGQTEVAALPARARAVLELLAQGLPDEQIATRLGIARNTLRNHIAAIYNKLGIHTRGAVVVWARERGLGAPAKPRVTQRKPRAAKRG